MMTGECKKAFNREVGWLLRLVLSKAHLNMLRVRWFNASAFIAIEICYDIEEEKHYWSVVDNYSLALLHVAHDAKSYDETVEDALTKANSIFNNWMRVKQGEQ